MLTRPVAAVTGAVLGFSALFLSAPAALAAGSPGGPEIFAHRGASGYAPENTLAAADRADELDTVWVENDVQRTKDGALVVIHDTTLARTTDVEEVFPGRSPWKVSDFTLDEIRQLDAGSWFSGEYAGERIPTLRQFLHRLSWNRQNLLLEIKAPELYPGIERQILRELRRTGWLSPYHVRHKLIVQSFAADSIRTVHEQRPDVRTGFLGTPAVADLPSYAEFTDQINPSHRTVTADYVDAVHRLKGPHGKRMELLTWTVNDGPTAVRLAGLGIDGIITNKPDVVRDAVRGESAAPGALLPSAG